jgi:PST family polysaccharide transporter
LKSGEIENKFIHGAKWSIVTEVLAKIIAPLTNMILARIISPEVFGVIATVTMIVSFCEMFADAGFQKYLIQHEFSKPADKYKYANVAFWTNFFVALFLLLLIIVFRDWLSTLVGNPGKGIVIVVASTQLFITAFSSIQMALFKRDFDFKTLFYSRILTVSIPFVVTIPLAIAGLSYWSLVIGGLASQLANALILTIKSDWKPQLTYDFEVFKRMFSFSSWSLLESISIWFTAWIDVFVISQSLTQYYLGIYKTSTMLVNAIMSLVVSSIVPVLFSALSRLQNDREKFIELYFKVQRLVALFVLPLGVILYFYSDLATRVMLGDKWMEASKVLGIWALTSSIMVVFAHFSSEVYRSLGRPRLSFLAQVLHLIVLIPVCIFSSDYGFWALVYSRAWVRMEFLLVHIIIMKYFVGIKFSETMQNVKPMLLATIILFLVNSVIFHFVVPNIGFSILLILLNSFIYILVLTLFKDFRLEYLPIVKRFFFNFKFIKYEN